MPELPDLVRVEQVLGETVVGKRVVSARTGDPTVLRVMMPEPFPASLTGKVLTGARRRGHFMRFAFDTDVVLVVNAMLVGKYKVLPPAAAAAEKDPVGLGFAVVFEDGSELRYIDDKRMGKVYVARPADEARIPIYSELGVDIVSADFGRAHFLTLARKRRDQARMFLMDKRALASIGNAYADEILFAARIHPKTFMRQLTEDDLDRLFLAIGAVMRNAIEEIRRRDQPVEVKVRDFLEVRGRDGKPCHVCGTTLRAVRVGDGDACFCPTCQPTNRRLFVDWGRLPAGKVEAPPAPAATAAVSSAPRRESARPPVADGTAPRRPPSRRSASRRRAPSES